MGGIFGSGSTDIVLEKLQRVYKTKEILSTMLIILTNLTLHEIPILKITLSVQSIHIKKVNAFFPN